MPKRRSIRSSNISSKKRKTSGNKNKLPEAYEIEEIIEQKLVNREIHYFLKWVGYKHDENTWEPENRLMSPEKLLKFAEKQIDSSYNENIRKILETVKSSTPAEFLKNANHLAIIALNFYQMGTFQFMSADAIGSKKIMLESIMSNDHEWIMRTIQSCTENEIKSDLEKYSFDLKKRIESSIDYPVVSVCYSNPMVMRAFLPPPPPMANLIFSPIDQEDVLRRNYKDIIVEKSGSMGFDGTQAYTAHNHDSDENESTDGIEISNRNTQRFNCAFTLQYMREDIGWTLKANHYIEEGTPLMKMAGVLCPITTAIDAHRKSGEIVAFPSFVAIASSGYCLDRRRYYDFSRFIQHSCDPNCSVRLAESGSEINDVCVFAKREIAEEEALTIDYFECFEADVAEFLDTIPLDNDEFKQSVYLCEHRIDHVFCQCRADNCRKILYVENCEKEITSVTTKMQKIKEPFVHTKFYGLYLLDNEDVHVFNKEEVSNHCENQNNDENVHSRNSSFENNNVKNNNEGEQKNNNTSFELFED